MGFLLVKVAKSWGLKPLAFAACPRDEQLIMIAEYTASQKIAMWEQDQAVDDAKRENSPDRRLIIGR